MSSNTNFLAHFESHLLAEKRVAQNTFAAYKKDIDQLVEFLCAKKVEIRSCKTDDLKKFIGYLKRKGLNSKTIARKISTLKLFFGYLSEKFNISNSAESLIFPKHQKSFPSFLTEQEIEILFKTAGEDESSRGIRNRVIIFLLYASGIRVSELVNLTIDQIHFDTGFIRLMGKGNKERVIPLPKPMLELLRQYIDVIRRDFLPKKSIIKTDFLFISGFGKEVKPITRQSIWNILKKILMLSGIKKKVSPHSLRHSIATHLLKNGANLRSLQMLLGHEQLSTVQIYTHLDDSHLRIVYDKAHPRS
ncbi:tyrosine recombinase [Candidatus Babeliales bacterium]|nr:tyrosine recombinase [Candidatus Babeliales bacterium]